MCNCKAVLDFILKFLRMHYILNMDFLNQRASRNEVNISLIQFVNIVNIFFGNPSNREKINFDFKNLVEQIKSYNKKSEKAVFKKLQKSEKFSPFINIVAIKMTIYKKGSAKESIKIDVKNVDKIPQNKSNFFKNLLRSFSHAE